MRRITESVTIRARRGYALRSERYADGLSAFVVRQDDDAHVGLDPRPFETFREAEAYYEDTLAICDAQDAEIEAHEASLP